MWSIKFSLTLLGAPVAVIVVVVVAVVAVVVFVIAVVVVHPRNLTLKFG